MPINTNYYWDYYKRNNFARPNTYNNVPQQNLYANQTDVFKFSESSACKDGKDDGSIGFWEATKNVLKGGVKFVTGMFTDENGDFSLKQTLKTVGMGVAIGLATMIPVVGPLVLPALCTYGMLHGGKEVLSGISNAMSAKTDAEAEQAWQQVGSGATEGTLSYVGYKATGGFKKAWSKITADYAALKTNVNTKPTSSVSETTAESSVKPAETPVSETTAESSVKPAETPVEETTSKPVKAEAEAEAKAKVEAETKAKAEAEVKANAEAEAKAKAEAETKAKAEAETKAKAEAEAKAKAEAEAKAKAEAEAKAKAEAEAKAKAEAEAKAKAEAEAKAKAEAEAKAKAEAEAKAKAEAEAKAKAEAEAKAKEEAEAKAKAEAEAKAKSEAEAKAKAETEAKTKAEAEAKAKAETEAKAKPEAESKVEQKDITEYNNESLLIDSEVEIIQNATDLSGKEYLSITDNTPKHGPFTNVCFGTGGRFKSPNSLINEYLRTGKIWREDYSAEVINDIVNSMDNVMKQNKLSNNTILYRNINDADFIPEVGEIFLEKGYTATSRVSEFADYGYGNIEVEIIAPANTKCYIPGNQFQEVVLNRNTPFKVIEKTDGYIKLLLLNN